MSCLRGLLEKVGKDVQPEVQAQLRGFFGGMVRAYLPQTWVFQTDDGAVSLHVDRAGVVTVTSVAEAHPDVTIKVGHDRLATVLRTRRDAAADSGPLTVTPHTAKGRTAFNYLRGRLGL